MHILFILLSLLGSFYFLIKKRTFDFFSVAYFSSIIYFLPGYFGYTLVSPTSLKMYILDETYLIMIFVQMSILVGGCFFDTLRKKTEIKTTIKNTNLTSEIALFICLLGFMLTIISSGSNLFDANKGVMVESLGRWHMIMRFGAALAVVIAFVMKKKLIFIISLLVILFDIFLGFRSIAAIVTISLITYWLTKQGSQRLLINQRKFVKYTLILGLFFFSYKQVYSAIKGGNWELVKERISDPQFYIYSIMNSEPFTTQSILNTVVASNFQTGFENMIGLIYQFILFSPSLGAEFITFNQQFQPALFPTITFGLANNIWAQMWSVGGWTLLILFLIINILILSFGSYLIRMNDPNLKALILLLFSYWSFYIHRNDIIYQINLEKRVFLFWFICILTSVIINSIVKKSINKY